MYVCDLIFEVIVLIEYWVIRKKGKGMWCFKGDINNMLIWFDGKVDECWGWCGWVEICFVFIFFYVRWFSSGYIG